jgi:hypothetical protein
MSGQSDIELLVDEINRLRALVLPLEPPFQLPDTQQDQPASDRVTCWKCGEHIGQRDTLPSAPGERPKENP